MILLLQRVRRACVEVAGSVVGEIDAGLLVFVCAEPQDDEAVVSRAVDKVLKLRIFGDEQGRMNRSVRDTAGGLLAVSQFTLGADTGGGNRPSFSAVAPPDQGRALYEAFLRLASQRHPVVQSGVFGAEMRVSLVNDGPVTIPMRVR